MRLDQYHRTPLPEKPLLLATKVLDPSSQASYLNKRVISPDLQIDFR